MDNADVAAALENNPAGINLGTADLTDIKADVAAALAAYEILPPNAKAALAAEKAQLDATKEKIEHVETAQAFLDGLEEGFDISPDEVDTLDKAVGLLSDLAEALAKLDALPEAVQDLLAEEIERLEELKGKAEEIVAGSATDGQKAEAAGFRAGYTAILAKTPETVSLADEVAVDAALAAYAGLADPVVKGLLSAEYQQLAALKAKIAELKNVTRQYTITYVLDGGTNAGANPATYTAADLPLTLVAPTLAAPTRTGYTFGGWYTNSGFTGTAVTQIPAGSTGNKTFYAKWTPTAAEPETYTITYELNGGTNAAENPATYTDADLPLTLAAPTRAGYTFEGWYGDTAFSGAALTAIPAGTTGNKTFYAKWTPTAAEPETYTITYVLNEGTNAGTNPATYTAADLPLTLATPTRTGDYTFGGWYTDSGFSGTALTSIPAGSMGHKTFYAKWTAVYTISYVLNGGTNDPDNPASYTISSSSIFLDPPTRTSYTFGGWYSDSGFTGSPVFSIPADSTGNKTFYAKWTLNSHYQPITLSIEDFTDEAAGAFDDTPFSLAKSGGTKPIEVESGVTDVSWYIGLVKIGTGNSIELSAANLTLGTHTLRVTARYDGILHSKELAFTVIN